MDHLLSENQVAVCGPILTELYRGFQKERERKEAIKLFEGCRFLSQPDRLWEEVGDNSTKSFLVFI